MFLECRLLKLMEEVNDGTVFKKEYAHVDKIPETNDQMAVLPFWLDFEYQRLCTVSCIDKYCT
jgi:hypothetical protein